jgi:hypothetical protein
MNPIKKFFRKITVLRLHRLTLDNLEKKMGEEEFHINLKNDLLKAIAGNSVSYGIYSKR